MEHFHIPVPHQAYIVDLDASDGTDLSDNTNWKTIDLFLSSSAVTSARPSVSLPPALPTPIASAVSQAQLSPGGPTSSKAKKTGKHRLGRSSKKKKMQSNIDHLEHVANTVAEKHNSEQSNPSLHIKTRPIARLQLGTCEHKTKSQCTHKCQKPSAAKLKNVQYRLKLPGRLSKIGAETTLDTSKTLAEEFRKLPTRRGQVQAAVRRLGHTIKKLGLTITSYLERGNLFISTHPLVMETMMKSI
ncbi:hypothetical protein M422DRAFT_49097 [Sphaerobolus stellatus SS14]|uniref:Unplaced genomic scaffold SPHSTscaffold_68, whole genome shotgun sequence n=1 Tax=Sphaerobolus stellatus (strain SS14) TaxID=990650 RepID=A0A0C9VGJ1_SPHS4|nr:hypothetical protein M422DRAFT_49097 [Sphaerobolus stellatus SS14]